MKKLVPVIVLAVIAGCSGGNEFKKFSGALPVLQMPLKFDNSGLIQADAHVSVPDEFRRYLPSGADLVLGKLYEDDKTIGIVYLRTGDVNTPVVMTYSPDGVKLDSANLFAYDDDLQGADVKRLVTFLSDRKIQTVDSVLIWTEIYPDGEPDITDATRVQQLSMDTVIRLIDKSGKIVKE